MEIDSPTRTWVLKNLKTLFLWLVSEDLLDRVLKVPPPKLPHTAFLILSFEDLPRAFPTSRLTPLTLHGDRLPKPGANRLGA